jgi:hypothetical protein
LVGWEGKGFFSVGTERETAPNEARKMFDIPDQECGGNVRSVYVCLMESNDITEGTKIGGEKGIVCFAWKGVTSLIPRNRITEDGKCHQKKFILQK